MFQLRKIATGIALGALASAAGTAHAVTWADLTSDNGATGQVFGSIGTVGVTYSGGYSFDILNDNNPNYWGSVPVTSSDIIALSAANTGTFTFSAPVTNVYIAFDSWNGADVTFSAPFTIVSQDASVFGSGTFVPNADNTGFFGNGETAGVLEFAGTFTSLTFTDTNGEYWHGLTVGIDGPAVAAVPESSTWAMMLVGFGMAGLAVRARRRQAAQVTYG